MSEQIWPPSRLIINSREKALQLFEENQGLVTTAGKQFFSLTPRPIPKEDMMQILEMVFWGACLTFDETKAALSTWTYRIFKHRVPRQLKSYFDRVGCEALPEDDIIKMPIRLSVLERIIAHEVYLLNFQVNDPRYSDILIQRVIGEVTLEDLGTIYGVTRERIRQIETNAILKLRSCFNNKKAVLIS
jgi:RNA polymerase sigma factor (sigma-70 family)